MKQIADYAGVKLSKKPVLMPPAADSEGQLYSIMHSGRVAQCQRCLDVGRHGVAGLQVGDPQFGRTVPCELCNNGNRQVPIESQLLAAHVPPELHHLTLRGWGEAFPEHPDIYRALVSFAANGRSKSGQYGLYLQGETGVGKTGAGLGILETMLPRVIGFARWMVWADFLDLIKASWKTESSLTIAEAITEVNRASLLVVDEFGGSGTGSGDPAWRADVARRLTDARAYAAQAGKVTIYTSQLSMDGIESEFGGKPIGEAIVSRIAGHCTVFEIVGRDARMEGAPE